MTSGEKAICLLVLPIQRSLNDCKLEENRLATDNGGVMRKLVVFWIVTKAMAAVDSVKAQERQ